MQDYESVISDIEETLSVLSRNSRSTTPASRTPTPSFGQINYFSMTDLANKPHPSITDKHIIPIVSVFDDLKDYLSDSDLSLEYQIARHRHSKRTQNKNMKKQVQLSNMLTNKKLMEKHEMSKDEKKDMIQDKLLSGDKNNPFKSTSCSNIFQNVFDSVDKREKLQPSVEFLQNKKNAEVVRNGKNSVNLEAAKMANEHELVSHKDSLLKNKQENDAAVRKINTTLDASHSYSPSKNAALPSNNSLLRQTQQVFNENKEKSFEKKKYDLPDNYTLINSSNTFNNNNEALNYGPENHGRSSVTEDYNSNSLKRKKELKTASLINLVGNNHEHSSYSQNKKHISNGFAKSFSNIFHESSISRPQQYNCGFAEKKSVSSYSGNGLQTSQSEASIPKFNQSQNSISDLDIIRHYMGFSDKKEEASQNIHEFRSECIN